jgi:hypothetical protein
MKPVSKKLTPDIPIPCHPMVWLYIRLTLSPSIHRLVRWGPMQGQLNNETA